MHKVNVEELPESGRKFIRRVCQCSGGTKRMHYIWQKGFFVCITELPSNELLVQGCVHEEWELCPVCASKMKHNVDEHNTEVLYSLTGGR